jgi:hypothetical protein
MPKRNLIGMVALSLLVAGGAALLALQAKAPDRELADLGSLIRQLGDPDPDIRRDAEREIRTLGPRAAPALKEAASGADPAVAERARSLLERMKPETVSTDIRTTPVDPDPAPVPRRTEVTLQVASSSVRPGEPLRFYLRLHNGGRQPLLIARHRLGSAALYGAYAAFERIDREGRVAAVSIEPQPGEDDESPEPELIAVAAGESIDLGAASTGALRIGTPGVYTLRFVYDASEGGAYRKAIAGAHLKGAVLPPGRLVSNEVAVTVQ